MMQLYLPTIVHGSIVVQIFDLKTSSTSVTVSPAAVGAVVSTSTAA